MREWPAWRQITSRMLAVRLADENFNAGKHVHPVKNKKAPAIGRSLCSSFDGLDYLSWVEMLENLLFKLVPRPLTTAIIATEMPAAMRPYSIAVAPELSFTKRTKRFFIGSSLRSTRGCLRSEERR